VKTVAAPAADQPRSPRGARTRAALLRGAREVFERDGFVDAKITAITAAAGVAAGSFYTHFASKDAIFEAVIDEIHAATLHPPMKEIAPPGDRIAAIEATNRAYLELYRDNARLFALVDQVAEVDDHFRAIRLERARVFAERNARAIRRFQEDGVADPALDPLATAHALDAMTSRMARLVFVQGQDMTFDVLLDTLTRLWVNALRLKPDKES
jgi:AcrR family transcriptional regulator